jgi:hypothetical protein
VSTFFQTPDSFDEITAGVPMPSPWQAMWNDAEEMLLQARPEGFTPEDIGQAAFDCLPEQEREEALGVLFYTYWAATLADRQTRRELSEGGDR